MSVKNKQNSSVTFLERAKFLKTVIMLLQFMTDWPYFLNVFS